MGSRLINEATNATPDLFPVTGRHRTTLFGRRVDGWAPLIVPAAADIWGVKEPTGSGTCVRPAFDRNTGPQGDAT